MRLRSLLFVPADSERKLARAGAAGADALILDLEDAVAPGAKARARAMAAEFLASRPGPTWVRVNPVQGPLALADLAAVMPARPDGIMLPKGGPGECARLSAWLDAFEAASGIAVGSTPILPVATETPAAALALGQFAQAGLTRLAGLTWGAEDLSAELGAATNRDPLGRFAFPYQVVRAQCLLAARSAGVLAIDTLWADFRDLEGLRADTALAAQEGWDGRMAIHPDQVAIIHAALAPSPEAVAHARAVVAAFAADPGAGVVALEGRMLDAPHLKAAQRVLARAGEPAAP